MSDKTELDSRFMRLFAGYVHGRISGKVSKLLRNWHGGALSNSLSGTCNWSPESRGADA